LHTHDTRQCAASDSNRSGYRRRRAALYRSLQPRSSRYETTSGPTGQRCSCRRTLSLGRIASCAHPTQPTPPLRAAASARSDRGVPLADARSACAPPVLAHGRTAVGLRTWSRRGQSSRSSWCRPKRGTAQPCKRFVHAAVIQLTTAAISAQGYMLRCCAQGWLTILINRPWRGSLPGPWDRSGTPARSFPRMAHTCVRIGACKANPSTVRTCHAHIGQHATCSLWYTRRQRCVHRRTCVAHSQA
jgi:hypothetical protein